LRKHIVLCILYYFSNRFLFCITITLGARDFPSLEKVSGYKHPTMCMICWSNSEKKVMAGLISTNNYNPSNCITDILHMHTKENCPKINFPKDVVINFDNPSTKSMVTELTKSSSTKNHMALHQSMPARRQTVFCASSLFLPTLRFEKLTMNTFTSILNFFLKMQVYFNLKKYWVFSTQVS
jgi:hypothetical protein